MLTSEKEGKEEERQKGERGLRDGEKQRKRKHEKVPRLLENFSIPLQGLKKNPEKHTRAPFMSHPLSLWILIPISQVQRNKISLFLFKTYNKSQYMNEESQTIL